LDLESIIILDTDVFSFLWMKPGDTRSKIYAPHTSGKSIAITFITLGELRFWGNKRNWSKKKWDDLASRLRSVVIIPYDDAICSVYAELKAELSKAGKTVADNDLWIAACAVRHGLTLLTNNRVHFENIPRLKFLSEAPVVMQIASQAELFENQKAKEAASARARPSSQSPSS
jgi:predicted nucleic acid-binding protein